MIKRNKMKIVSIISTVVLLILLSNSVIASSKNTTNKNTNKTGNIKNTAITDDTNTIDDENDENNENDNSENEDEQTKIKNNNHLSKLEIDGIEMHPDFNRNTLTYYVNIDTNVNSLDVDAVAENENAKITIDGNKNLKSTENTIKVTVKSESGKNRIYKIIATKQKSITIRLTSLQINGVELNPSFSQDEFEYNAKVEQEGNSIQINAKANESDAKVEIVGNENLKDGDNLITVIVTSKDETESVIYQIVLNKTTINPEKIELEAKAEKIEKIIKISIIIVAVIVFLIILATVIKLVRRRKYRKEKRLKREFDENESEEYAYIKLDEEDEKKSKSKNKTKKTSKDIETKETKKKTEEKKDDKSNKNKGKHS